MTYLSERGQVELEEHLGDVGAEPLVAQAAGGGGAVEGGHRRHEQHALAGGLRLVVNLSSQLGSIHNTFGAQGRFGGVACYRMSRAANNMAMRTFAGELAAGWVRRWPAAYAPRTGGP